MTGGIPQSSVFVHTYPNIFSGCILERKSCGAAEKLFRWVPNIPEEIPEEIPEGGYLVTLTSVARLYIIFPSPPAKTTLH